MSEPKDDLVERLRHGPYTLGKITGEILELSEAANRIDAQAKLIEGLRGYEILHNEDCEFAEPPFPGACTCGLTTLLASIKE